MAKVLYFDANLNGKAFDVLKENDNGTVDIGTVTTVVVGSCPLAEEPKHGFAIRCRAPVLKSEDGSQKTEVGGPKAEDGKPKPEGRTNRAE